MRINKIDSIKIYFATMEPRKRKMVIGGGTLFILLIFALLFMSGGSNNSTTQAAIYAQAQSMVMHTSTCDIQLFECNSTIFFPHNVLENDFYGEVTVEGPYIVSFTNISGHYKETRIYPYHSIQVLHDVDMIAPGIVSAGLFTNMQRTFTVDDNGNTIYKDDHETIIINDSTIIAIYSTNTLQYNVTFVITNPRNYESVGKIE